MKKYWAATPGVAKASFVLAAVTGLYLAGWIGFAMFMGSQSNQTGTGGPPSLGPIGAAIGAVMTMAMTFIPLAVIGVVLRVESVVAKGLGAALAALAALSGIALVLVPLFSIGPVESGGPGIWFWVPWGVLGAAYAPVAIIGFRDAVRLSHQGSRRITA